MDKITTDTREDGVKELLNTDNLVFFADSWKEVEKRYTRWKRATKEKSLKVNVKKTKAFLYWQENSSFYVSMLSMPKRRGKNSILCIKCNSWLHRRCSGIRKLNQSNISYMQDMFWFY